MLSGHPSTRRRYSQSFTAFVPVEVYKTDPSSGEIGAEPFYFDLVSVPAMSFLVHLLHPGEHDSRRWPTFARGEQYRTVLRPLGETPLGETTFTSTVNPSLVQSPAELRSLQQL
jgi:hypothetical protein